MKINTFIIVLTILILTFNFLHARCLYSKKWHNQELEIEFDPYYSDVDYYFYLTREKIPYVTEENELKIYETLFTSSLLPKYFVLEASVNPMPLLGVAVRKSYPDVYDRATVKKDFNLIESICAGFDEPYAASLFFGNVLGFSPEKYRQEGREGRAYMGYLISVGDLNIKDSILIQDNWFELEWKVKGYRTTPHNKIMWSFRVGTKQHGNPYIKDTFYFSIYRDRIEYNYSGFSPFKNANIEYRMDYDPETRSTIRHFFVVGRDFPIKNSKITPQLGIGYLWEGSQKYTGPLTRTEKPEESQILIRPNILF
ncbi:MAG: hypothetical protein AB1633_08235 [Elusimicrobiota bacterium]